jgi:hypothetical protein
MLDRGHDESPAVFARQPPKRQVICFCAAAGEDQAVGPSSLQTRTEHCGDRLACILDDSPRLSSGRMLTG